MEKSFVAARIGLQCGELARDSIRHGKLMFRPVPDGFIFFHRLSEVETQQKASERGRRKINERFFVFFFVALIMEKSSISLSTDWLCVR